jgi:hypothetical protein
MHERIMHEIVSQDVHSVLGNDHGTSNYAHTQKRKEVKLSPQQAMKAYRVVRC